ncbi:MAG: nitrous oxide reductase family maturation protein NosD [Melioribacter sp.]|uniref:nitrous oxide reductase family maturation protein NosD n=1 Tax=Rosettibacter primus TaxID=3111523 RepID=UPI00247DACC8|nr:nitrous oxide reductase family maturation protein NosD [Melioribacter sp.]
MKCINEISKNIINYIFIFTAILFFNLIDTEGKTIIVDKISLYKTIKSALNASKNFDTIIIKQNNYSEGTLIIDKQLTLIGDNFPVLNGEGKNQIIIVKSSNVKITGFIFKNAGVSFLSDNSAIKIDSVSNCIIENNKFINNFFAVYLSKSSRCKIINNQIKSNSTKQTLSGNGIHLWNCRDILIQGNRIEGHRDGIYLEFVKHSQIIKNISKNNLRYGLHFMFSDSCFYKENYFERNKSGVAVMFTKNVLMENNIFMNNWGSASYGILLKEIYDSIILNNTFKKNSCGIYFEACNRIAVQKNNFIENGWAIKLMANSMDNIFKNNNFIENTFDISTNSTHNYNSFKNNFWSKYDGYDLNKDNIGDVPYRPVKLFSFIVVSNPPALILLRSFFIDILDFAEKIIPTITPSDLIDSEPLMKKIL